MIADVDLGGIGTIMLGLGSLGALGLSIYQQHRLNDQRGRIETLEREKEGDQ